MILVDTSIWIDHLRAGDPALAGLLYSETVLTHPFVIGELACGNLKNRAQILGDLRTLPSATVASHEEVLHLIDTRGLAGRGIGWTDAHLIAAAVLTNCRFWTRDSRLQDVASTCGVNAEPRPS